jgi:predicted amidohydrolase
MQDLKIAMVQSFQYWEDIDANLKMFGEKVRSITEPVDIIVLPEMFSTGFSMNPASLYETMDGKALNWMKAFATESNAVITGSLIIKENENYYNRLVWMHPDGSYETYDKRHLFSMAGEEKVFSPGDKKLIVELKGWKICPMVCYDLRFPVWIRNVENYDLLLFVANWPDKRIEHWRKLLQARAIENQCFVVGVNRIGKDGNEIPYTGHSMFVNSQGEILTEIINEDKVEIITCNDESLIMTRRHMPFLNDRDRFRLE